MNTQAMMRERDAQASIREVLLRRHAMLRDRFQTLKLRAGSIEIDSDGSILATGEEVQAAVQEVSRQIVETDLALAKVDQGTYGVCDGCGRPIPPRRLEVLPTATRCVACVATSRERTGPDLHASRGVTRRQSTR